MEIIRDVNNHEGVTTMGIVRGGIIIMGIIKGNNHGNNFRVIRAIALLALLPS
jgi:hypothetical protein